MSTTLSPAFRFPSSSLPETLAWRARVRPAIEGALRQALQRDQVRLAVAAFDSAVCGAAGLAEKTPLHEETDFRDPGSLLSLAWASLRKESPDAHPLERNARFVVAPDPKTGDLYGLLQTRNRAAVLAFQAASGLDRFDYWNGSDPPSEVDETEWESRKDVWERILGEHVRLSEVGFSLELAEHQNIWVRAPETPEEVSALLPSLEERIAHRARQIVLHQDVQKHEAEFGPITKMSTFVQLSLDAADPDRQVRKDMDFLVGAALAGELKLDELTECGWRERAQVRGEHARMQRDLPRGHETGRTAPRF